MVTSLFDTLFFHLPPAPFILFVYIISWQDDLCFTLKFGLDNIFMNKYVLNNYAVVSALYCYYCSMMLQKPGQFPNECCIVLLNAFSLENSDVCDCVITEKTVAIVIEMTKWFSFSSADIHRGQGRTWRGDKKYNKNSKLTV